jgi:hypothetical protein
MSDSATLDVLGTTIECVEELVKREEAQNEKLREIAERIDEVTRTIEERLGVAS